MGSQGELLQPWLANRGRRNHLLEAQAEAKRIASRVSRTAVLHIL